MYVDENGNANLREDYTKNDNRFLCLTGVAMRLPTHNILEQELNNVKLHYFGSTEIILHRREIISGKPPFESLKDDYMRSCFNSDILKVMAQVEYRVISVLIDKKAHIDKYGMINARDPYALALEFLMQRYQYWLQRCCKVYGEVLGDILAEARGGHEDRITKETYSLIYEGKGYNRLRHADKYFSSKEIKLKKKRDNIAGLQFVDLISHPARRYILLQNDLANDIKSTSFEQKVVEILVEDKFCRDGNGKIKSYGTVCFP
jgi:hypothetical protein